MTTKISWTDETWNPITGCEVVSEGCDHCYAARMAVRLQRLPAYEGTATKEGWTGQLNMRPELLEQPLLWKRPRMVFVNSMSDLFHPKVLSMVHEPTGLSYLAELFAVMLAAQQHTFQILTKRPQLMAAVLNGPLLRLQINAALFRRGLCVVAPGAGADFWWPSNIWLGTSIETDRWAFRANHLRKINAVRFISAEPLLGPLPSLDLSGIDWLIAGAESGPKARPMDEDWVRDLRDRAMLSSRRVAFFYKQRIGADGKKEETPELDGERWVQMPRADGRQP